MEFQANLPPLDVEQEAAHLVGFIRDQVFNRYKRRGIVVGLSGGVDSAVTAVLSLRAVGREKLKALILPEKESSPLSAKLARELAEKFGLEYETRDITDILDRFGVYQIRSGVVRKYFPEFNDRQKWLLAQPGNIMEKAGLNYYLIRLVTDDGVQARRLAPDDLRIMISATDVKQRTRMACLYQAAERNHYLVAGTTNLSEMDLGFFVKYGDGGVDIEPLSHLYKTYIFQMARYLDVPQAIINRTPSPDTFSAKVTDEEFFFRLPYEQLDLFLWAIRENIPLETVGKTLQLDIETVRRIVTDLKRKIEISEHLRRLPATASHVLP